MLIAGCHDVVSRPHLTAAHKTKTIGRIMSVGVCVHLFAFDVTIAVGNLRQTGIASRLTNEMLR